MKLKLLNTQRVLIYLFIKWEVNSIKNFYCKMAKV